jgi:hypothetical protein
MAVCLFAVALTGLSTGLSRANQGSPFDLTPPQATPPQKPESPAPLPEIKQPSANAAPATPAPGAGAPKADNTVSGCGLPYHLVEETCYVPILVHEKRKVQCIEYTTEQHEQQISLMRLVPEKQTIKQQYTVLVPETRTRTENYTVCKPVQSTDSCGCCCTKYVQETKQRQVQYTVCVPQMKECSREITVCKYVPEQRTIMVSVCVPHPVEKEVDVCAYHLTTKKVMVPVPNCTCCCMPCVGLGPCCGWGCGGCW